VSNRRFREATGWAPEVRSAGKAGAASPRGWRVERSRARDGGRPDIAPGVLDKLVADAYLGSAP